MDGAVTTEAHRIRAEYGRRATEISSERYAVAQPAALFIRQTVERAALVALREAGSLPLGDRRILDVGCGAGQWLVDLETWGARGDRLSGIDLVEERASACRKRVRDADVRVGDASSLPWPDGSFDIVLQSMLMSSVLDLEMRTTVAAEMARVLAPGGLVLWYDFFVGNPRNPSVRGIRRGELAELFEGFEIAWRRVTLAPPLVRALVPRARLLASTLQALKALDTHAVAVLRRT
jgi:ubiquinone/menaquinone biosynthesis C-methylase UbiE